jgi:hypothetical protein
MRLAAFSHLAILTGQKSLGDALTRGASHDEENIRNIIRWSAIIPDCRARIQNEGDDDASCWEKASSSQLSA